MWIFIFSTNWTTFLSLSLYFKPDLHSHNRNGTSAMKREKKELCYAHFRWRESPVPHRFDWKWLFVVNSVCVHVRAHKTHKHSLWTATFQQNRESGNERIYFRFSECNGTHTCIFGFLLINGCTFHAYGECVNKRCTVLMMCTSLTLFLYQSSFSQCICVMFTFTSVSCCILEAKITNGMRRVCALLRAI